MSEVFYMTKPFFHEAVDKQKFDDMAETGKTWGDVMREYEQPSWCTYNGALEGQMGCWSLISFKIKDKDSCKGCELCK